MLLAVRHGLIKEHIMTEKKTPKKKPATKSAKKPEGQLHIEAVEKDREACIKATK